MALGHMAGVAILSWLVGCHDNATPAGPAGCWNESQGLCQEWATPPKESEASCRASDGTWVFPTCLNVDAVGSCVSNGRDSQIFYSSAKFTAEQAKAECAARTGFTFSTGNERTVIGGKK